MCIFNNNIYNKLLYKKKYSNFFYINIITLYNMYYNHLVNDMILLDCGHIYDIFYIQQYIVYKLDTKEPTVCPYCNKIINRKILKKILKKWLIINYTPVDHIDTSKYIDMMDKNILYITQLNELNIFTKNRVGRIIIPYYNNNTYPKFFISPLIDRLVKINNIYNFKELKSIYSDEVINNMNCFFLDGHINTNNDNWHIILKKIFKQIKFIDKSYYNNSSLCEMVEQSNIMIRFYIRNIKNITTNNKNITGDYIIDLLNLKCRCLYRTYFLLMDDDIYLINELYHIYYETTLYDFNNYSIQI